MSTFSVIVPAHDSEMATARTCANLVYQRGRKVPREVLVVADGPTKWARSVARTANKKAQDEGQPVEFIYSHTPRFNGTGNIGRAQALLQAKNDYVLFIDSGTVCLDHMFEMLDFAVQEKPDTELIAWDVIQMVDPVPFIHFSAHLEPIVNDDKIGYYIPGVGAAIRREIGQTVKWPNTGTSDWAYWSAIWKKLSKPVKLTALKHPLVIAYAGYDNKRWRRIPSPDQWLKDGYDKSFDESPYADWIANG
jgi:Glycosyltransferases, probably involved in cell wall biogenesis